MMDLLCLGEYVEASNFGAAVVYENLKGSMLHTDIAFKGKMGKTRSQRVETSVCTCRRRDCNRDVALVQHSAAFIQRIPNWSCHQSALALRVRISVAMSTATLKAPLSPCWLNPAAR